jgi:N-acylglucosamine-6-phosphate 2-epimerase
MAFMARAAIAGGAGGIRACGTADIAAIRAQVSAPIIGLTKRPVPHSPVYITPTFADARTVATSGADLVAIDATDRQRPDGIDPADLIARIVAELGIAVVADIDGVEAGARAAKAGALFVSTTLAGYTAEPVPTEPDIGLVARLTEVVGPMVIAEGRYRDPEAIALAFGAGAFAVVVGKAITDPLDLTRRLVRATPSHARGS